MENRLQVANQIDFVKGKYIRELVDCITSNHLEKRLVTILEFREHRDLLMERY